jgi:membrane associated rhomboid family serine protease
VTLGGLRPSLSTVLCVIPAKAGTHRCLGTVLPCCIRRADKWVPAFAGMTTEVVINQMFVPLHDDTPLQVIRFQYVTGALIVINTVVFLMTGAFTSEQSLAMLASGYGVVPAELTHAIGPVPAANPIPEPLTLITYQFLHAGWLHLISNMLFLWVFADNIEDAFGHAAFLFFYLLSGIAGGLLHAVMMPSSPAPLIGASGAVSGVLAAYLVLYPKARVWILLFLRIPIRLPALWVLGGWAVLQLVSMAITTSDEEIDVAWWAHIGGFSAGLAMTLLLRSRLLVRPTR